MFEKVTESWEWTADTSLLGALGFPLFLLLVVAPMVAFSFMRVRGMGPSGHLLIRNSYDISKRHRVVGFSVAGLVAAGALVIGVVNAVNWTTGDRVSSGGESREYLTFTGTIESSSVGSSTFFSDSASQLWLRVEGHPELLLKVNSSDDVAKFYERTDVDSGRLYCRIPEEGESALVCSSDKTDVHYDIEDPTRVPEDAEVKHEVKSEEWIQN